MNGQGDAMQQLRLTQFGIICFALSLIGCGGGSSDSGTPNAPLTSPTTTTSSASTTSTTPSSSTTSSSPSVVVSTTENDAARFLTQATFGPTLDEIEDVAQNGLEAWLDAQINAPMSSHRAKTLAIFNADQNARDNNADSPWGGHRYGAWMDIAIHGQDQLRQRVAFALSQLFVVSDKSILDGQQLDVAGYYDGLALHAFGNYRDLLEYVTLSPVMGVYLNMLGNEKPDLANNIRPDENYAREVMQLFTIGLDELNIDGSLRLVDGQPIPTYDINIVKAYAHVFTGWHFRGTTADTWHRWWQNRNFRNPMTLVPEYHARDVRKTLLNDVVVEPGTDGETAMQMALDSLFEHPNVGPFVAKHMIQRLVTSNPSPQYIARIARVFNDDGSGVRGNLEAVVRATLLDEAARAPINEQASSFGKIKEPIIRGMQLIRAFGLYKDGELGPQWLEYPHNQAPLAAPSVFNFFLDDFSPVGQLADSGLVAPEMQIINDTFMVRNSNHAGWWSMWVPSTAEVDGGHERGMTIDYAQFTPMIAQNVEPFIDYLDTVLLAGSMSSEMRNAMTSYDVQARQWLNDRERIQELVFLVTGSPQFAVQR